MGYESTSLPTMPSFSDPAQKTVVRQITHGLHLDKVDSFAEWWKERREGVRGCPGMKHVELAICGQGRLNVAYEFIDLESFQAFMASDFYKEFKESFVKGDFFNADVTPAEFVGFKQPNFCLSVLVHCSG